ncbi:ATP-binding protein [Herbaspirillum camelliae]|uniref:ATP-binding protein n=1 Tax=Herbaspirillum camelliae TaxID=1892903 RepID=UPI000949CC68|nr:ATP-binding protein [Herbaspirillum camelliae]
MNAIPLSMRQWYMSSLRRRLLLWLVPATLVAGMLASAATWWKSVSDLNDLLDDQMKVIGRHIQVDKEGKLNLVGKDRKGRLSGQRADGVLLQVWHGGELRFSSDDDATLPAPGQTGLNEIEANNVVWKTYVSRTGDIAIRVAQAKNARWTAIAEVAVHLFWPVLSILPIVALLLWFGIGYGLRPLRQVSSGLEHRDANNFQTISTAGIPSEVIPLVTSINDLLVRLERAFTTQKNFIADAAHELRTPITGLSLQVGLLPQAANAEEHHAIMMQIQNGTARLGRLASQLLTLARLDPESHTMSTGNVDLHMLAKAVVAERSLIAEAVPVDLGIDELSQTVQINGNSEELRILLNNLVDNAVRYSGTHARVDVGAFRSGAFAILQVRDTGPGIAPAELKRVGERFYRGTASGMIGSGLGLSIVHRIAEQHKASVSIGNGVENRGLLVRVAFHLP